ncbi:MAG TPA: hypothetical protein VGI60_01090 [Chthoniobacterales bacterium]|jgi:hypothetical protein
MNDGRLRSAGEIAFANHERSAFAAEASRQEIQRQLSIMRPTPPALSPKDLQLRGPILNADYGELLAKLDSKVRDSRIDFDGHKVMKHGEDGVHTLFSLELDARLEPIFGTNTDFTSFESVARPVLQAGAEDAITAPRRTMADEVAGTAQCLDKIRSVVSFLGFWKFGKGQPTAVRKCLAFYNEFVRLIFLQSICTWVSDDWRLSHRFFCSGSAGVKANCFESCCLSMLKGRHFRVILRDALSSIVLWLVGETSELPNPRSLYAEWSGKRCISPEEVLLSRSVVEAYLLGKSGWEAWDYIGTSCSSEPPDELIRGTWERDLKRRFPKVALFWSDTQQYFLESVLGHPGIFKKQSEKHRTFIEQKIEALRQCVSGIAALTLSENLPPDAIRARFRDFILCSGEAKPDIDELIRSKLVAAFPGGVFQVEIETL